jgi:hypothetical protein
MLGDCEFAFQFFKPVRFAPNQAIPSAAVHAIGNAKQT